MLRRLPLPHPPALLVYFFFQMTTSAQIRHYLGLTQEELSYYLGVSRARVADAETKGASTSRPYTYDALMRLNYLLLLLPTAAVSAFEKPTALAVDGPPAQSLPLPPPAAPLTPTEQEPLEWQLRTAQQKAAVLRHELGGRLAQATYHAQVQAHRRALLTAFAAPPAAAQSLRQVLPDSEPEYTQYLVDLLQRRVARPEWPAPNLTPAAIARDRLRLHLLEAEAATLAAWLGI
jgi:transcriptional regulator with XRE-family HTH domain